MLNALHFVLTLLLSGIAFRTLWRIAVTPLNKRFVLANTPTGVIQIGWLLLQMYVVFGWAAILSLIHI